MTVAWQRSAVYGSVALGPAQRDVLAVVIRLTDGGRRPELTLARLAELAGRPVSSVHDALGRLRALGLIGVSARMGRHGGHRLWRVQAAVSRILDSRRHRVAVARLRARWYPHHTSSRTGIAAGESPSPGPRADHMSSAADGRAAPPSGNPSAELWPSDAAGTGVHSQDGKSPGDGIHPPSPGGDHPYPDRVDPRETFAEKMRRHGLGDWAWRRDQDG